MTYELLKCTNYIQQLLMNFQQIDDAMNGVTINSTYSTRASAHNPIRVSCGDVYIL